MCFQQVGLSWRSLPLSYSNVGTDALATSHPDAPCAPGLTFVAKGNFNQSI